MKLMQIGNAKKIIFNLSGQYKYYLLLFVLTLVIFSPMGYSHAYLKTTDYLTDFHQHMLWAISLDQNGVGSIPAYVLAHSGWQILLIFLTRLLGISFNLAGFLAVLFLSEMTVLILSCWYFPVFSNMDRPLWRGVVTILGVSIAAPISAFWFFDHLMYLGYIGITSYHNPTMILLKPFAILQFIYAYHCFYENYSFKGWQVAAGGFISILATFIKPSLAICILPAVGIIVILRLIQKKYVNLVGLAFGIGLPTLLVLVWQFLLSYYENETGGIRFLPFSVMSAYSGYLVIKFFLSILFPLAVLVTFFKEAIRDIRMVLGWTIFAFGMIFTYCFAESGPRLLDGNFAWSGEIAMMLLFVISTLFCIEGSPKIQLQKRTLSLIWSLHIFFGVVYYLFCLFNYPYY
jgi:hypothetical protein